MAFKRLKTLFFSLWMAALSAAGPALAAGTTPLSLVQQFDSTGAPMAGCQLSFFVAGTVATPQNAYADFGLTTALPNPLTCDSTGRVPQHWLADGLIHIRLTDASGNPAVDTTMQVLGPSSGGGGGGGSVDPTTILATGDLKVKYGTGPISGFVRSNGLTIGNATSGATERANADTQALFIYLYNTDPNLVVSGGRTGNALNDYNANKTITLPDWRGRAIGALADMGNSATSVLTSTYFGTSPTVLGAAGGAQTTSITSAASIPTITSTGTITGSVGTGNGTYNTFVIAQNGFASLQGGGSVAGPISMFQETTATITSGTASVSSTNTGGGSTTPFGVVNPMLLATIYLKL